MSCGHCLLDFSLRLLLPFSVFFAAQHSTQKSLLSPLLTQAYVSSHQKRRKMRLSFSDKTIWVRFLSGSTVWRNRVYRYAVTRFTNKRWRYRIEHLALYAELAPKYLFHKHNKVVLIQLQNGGRFA